jgi:hypothetical protein
MAERFNVRIADLITQTRFAPAAELDSALKRYLNSYNHAIPQRALNNPTPSKPSSPGNTKNLNSSSTAFMNTRA